jgi:hypothetical protein
MAISDERHQKILYNDGEGIDYTDFNEQQYLMERKLYEQCLLGAGLGGYTQIDYDSSQGLDPYTVLVKSGLRIDRCYNPFSYFGPMRMDSLVRASGNMFFEQALLAQKYNSGVHTQPTGAGDVLARVAGAEEFDVGDWLNTNGAPGAGNDRWDTLGVLIDYEEGESESRDFEDAVTRAPSSTSQDKQMRYKWTLEMVQGSQTATYDMATLTTGYVPILTVARPAAEPSPLDIDDFYLNTYPMRMGFEDVMGADAYKVGASAWADDTTGYGSVVKNGAGAGELYFVPKTMHAGCRLIGVGVCRKGCNIDAHIEVGNYNHSSATGIPTFRCW